MKMMIVDDLSMSIWILERTIGAYGTTASYQDPERALRELRNAYRKCEPYDLLFLDIMMPNWNGLDLLKTVVRMGREASCQTKTKVVMVTSRNERQSIMEAIQSGASGYILKPFQPERVQAEILRLLGSQAPSPAEPGENPPGGDDREPDGDTEAA